MFYTKLNSDERVLALKEKLRILKSECKLNAAWFAEYVDIHPSAVSNWKKRGAPIWALILLDHIIQDNRIKTPESAEEHY